MDDRSRLEYARARADVPPGPALSRDEAYGTYCLWAGVGTVATVIAMGVVKGGFALAVVCAVIAPPIVACLGLLGVAIGCGLRVGGRGFTPASLAVFRVGGFATPLACAASLLFYGFASRYPGPIGLAILGIPTVCGLGTALMAMRRG